MNNSKIKEILKEYQEKRILKQTTSKEIADRYKNDENLVKIWISQDQKEKNKEIKSNEIILHNLKDLTLDLKYEIISFIPTYSNTYALQNKLNIEKSLDQLFNSAYYPRRRNRNLLLNNNYSSDDKEVIEKSNENKKKLNNVIKHLLEPNTVKEECKLTIDNALVTFHKMRLINKEYNRRMKLRILTLEHLNLDFILNKGSVIDSYNAQSYSKLNIWHLITLLKYQRMYCDYKEKQIRGSNGVIENNLIETILQLNHVTLYEENFIEEEQKLLESKQEQEMFGGKAPIATTSIFGGKGPLATKAPMKTIGSLGGSSAVATSSVGGKAPIATTSVFGGKGPLATKAPMKTTGPLGGEAPISNNSLFGTTFGTSSTNNQSSEDIEMISVEENKEKKLLIDINSLDLFELSDSDLKNLEEQELTNNLEEKLLNNNKLITETPKQTLFGLQQPEEVILDQPISYENTSNAIQLVANTNHYPYPSDSPVKPHLVDYIGDNKTIKSLQFDCSKYINYPLREDLKLIMDCLKNLTTITFVNYQDTSYTGHTNLTNTLPSVKEMNIIFMLDNYNFSFITTLIQSQQLQQFENLERINVFPLFDDGNPEIEESLRTLDLNLLFQSACQNITTDSFICVERNPTTNENKIHYELKNTDSRRNIGFYFTFGKNLRKEDWIWLTTTYFSNSVDGMINNQNFLCAKKGMNLKMKKSLLEYWVKNNYLLVENFPLGSFLLEDKEHLCLVQYLLYLANEYQNGRIFNRALSNQMNNQRLLNPDLYLYLVKYGYNFENQVMEILYLCNTGKSFEIIPFLVDALDFEKEETINEVVQFVSLKLYSTTFIENFLYIIYQHYGKEIIKKILLHTVYCLNDVRDLIELPLLVTLNKCSPHLLLEFIDLFTEKELISISDNGNNLCQLFICLNYQIDNRFILKIIEKVPEMLYTKNSDGDTLLHTCCKINEPSKGNLGYYLIKDLNISCDECDNKGRSVKQLLEKNHPLIARILFQYEGFPQNFDDHYY